MKYCNIIKTFSFLFCFLVIFDTKAKTFDLEEFTLDNGLRVIVVPNHKAPIIKHMVWYNVGSIDENLGKSGKAHLLEHLLFRGTKKVKDSDFSKIIEDHGGESNAFTGYDFTSYHQTLDITRLELAMFLEADRMENLNFSQESFEKERDIVFQERKQRVDNQPMGNFMEMFKAVLWGNHPYGRPIIGTDEEIKNFNYDDVISFYNSFYSPSNAILVLSGDITVEQAKFLANKYYGKVKKRDISQRPDVADLNIMHSTKIETSLPNINSPRIIKEYIADSYNTDKDRMFALIILSKILGEGDTSKLYKDLVTSQKAALGVSSSYGAFARGYSSFTFSLYPAFDLDVNDVLKAFEKSLQDSVSSITAEDVEIAKKKLLSGLVYIKDNPSDAAYIVGMMSSIGADMKDLIYYDENILKVSFDDVKKAAEDLFSGKPNVTAVITPLKGDVDE